MENQNDHLELTPENNANYQIFEFTLNNINYRVSVPMVEVKDLRNMPDDLQEIMMLRYTGRNTLLSNIQMQALVTAANNEFNKLNGWKIQSKRLRE